MLDLFGQPIDEPAITRPSPAIPKTEEKPKEQPINVPIRPYWVRRVSKLETWVLHDENKE